VRYQKEATPLVVFAGKEYGSGSSRDWAAKGPNLMGVRGRDRGIVRASHRSNLVDDGIIPLEFMPARRWLGSAHRRRDVHDPRARQARAEGEAHGRSDVTRREEKSFTVLSVSTIN